VDHLKRGSSAKRATSMSTILARVRVSVRVSVRVRVRARARVRVRVDVHDPEVREREVLPPRVQAARGLIAHAELEHVARRPAARREQRLVRRAVVVLRQPVRALVAAPLVEERCRARRTHR